MCSSELPIEVLPDAHDRKPYVCEECNEEFTAYRCLRGHRLSHFQEKQKLSSSNRLTEDSSSSYSHSNVKQNKMKNFNVKKPLMFDMFDMKPNESDACTENFSKTSESGVYPETSAYISKFGVYPEKFIISLKSLKTPCSNAVGASYVCDMGKTTFPDEDQLKGHSFEEAVEKDYTCDVCRKFSPVHCF
ncbi:hypothetical protein CEXT_274741 [Caerostris extrusa]|uniref:C2H2-type domain-containing protein n=1 Tax=Caerostris extrusa TaxID=172846 RepID=A0AAV4N417_CAEEX|nr:hypothetical protein CEXT_274741 [Caerostris extrusa]